jgi:signal peptidase I
VGRKAAPLGSVVLALLASTLTGCGGSKNAGPSTTYVSLQTVTVGVPSSSMEPTLHCARPASGCEANAADGAVVQPVQASDLKRGDIILFKTPLEAANRCGAGGRFLKRLIGLPGETVSERDGFVYINGKLLKEAYLAPDRRDHEPPRTWPRVPPESYFVLGDNRALSCDSRVWGSVAAGDVVGRVVKIIRVR